MCQGPSTQIAHALIAPFIVALSSQEGSQRSSTTLQECFRCHLGFFSHRFTDEELTAIYSQYRQTGYMETRRHWEPWYRRTVNDAFSEESHALRTRIKFMEELIDSANKSDFRLTVDLGGDGGQFFTRHSSGRRIVVDVSGKEVAPGIEQFQSLEAVQGNPDLVLICHVLEHLNDPTAMLQIVQQCLADDGFLYVEVPLDYPRVRPWHLRSAYRRYVAFVSSFRWLLIGLDFYSGVARQFGFRVPRFGLIKQSEHINYFDESSLQMCLELNGFEIVEMRSDRRASVGGLRLGKLGVLARLCRQTPNKSRE